MNNWYKIQNKAGVLSVDINDEIGLWGITAKDFINDIKGDHKQINVSINSPGGNVFDGIAMYNALRNHDAKVNTSVTGIAASAASIVLMAGDTVTMPEDAFIMIHNAWSITLGDAEEHRDAADTLDKITDSLINIYSKKTGQEAKALADMLSEETWMNGQDALESGFVDSLDEPAQIAALSKDFAKHFARLPDQLSERQRPGNIRDFENMLRDAGYSKNEAKTIASKGFNFNHRDDEKTSEMLGSITEMVKSFNFKEE